MDDNMHLLELPPFSNLRSKKSKNKKQYARVLTDGEKKEKAKGKEERKKQAGKDDNVNKLHSPFLHSFPHSIHYIDFFPSLALSSILYPHLFRGSQANSTLLEIIHAVPPSQERITKDSQWANWLGHIHSHKGGHAASAHLEDVIVSAEGEVVTGEGEGDIWEVIALLAVDAVLAVEALLGADLLVEELSEGGGEGVEGSTGVEYDTSVVEIRLDVAKGDGVEVDLPVGLAAEGNVGQLARVVGLVDATENGLGLRLVVGEVEGEDLLVEKALLNHVVEGGGDLVHRDGIEAKTQDAVEATEGEGKSGLLDGLAEELVLDHQVADGDLVLGDESTDAAGAILDSELGAVLLVAGRLARVVLAVEVAGDGAARLGWNPEVGASGIKDDLEVLWWVADGDLGEV